MNQKIEESSRMWQRFVDTGEIGAYLMYRAMRSTKEAQPPEE